MRIIVGSTNPVKVDAVREIMPQYPCLASADIDCVSAESGVSGQPKSLEETLAGAVARSRDAWARAGLSSGDLAFGIESGLLVVPDCASGIMDICACAIFDGRDVHMGISSAFVCPPAVIECMRRDGVEVQEACLRVGITPHADLGRREGLIGVLTRGRVTRKEYTVQAVKSAMIGVETECFTKILEPLMEKRGA